MTQYHASRADIRELAEASDRVTEIRRELEVSEERVREIRVRLQMAETQLSNAIRQVVGSERDSPSA